MTPLLDVRHLGFAFEHAGKTLRDITFTVNEGERVGVVGANGAGKTTLLWCLLGLLRGTGEIRVNGTSACASQTPSIGAVFQNPDDQLFMPRLLDDLVLPLVNRGVPAPEASARARATLESLGLQSAAGRPASCLSLGERKRAAIAAALVTRPSLVVLDEPTAELDGRSVRRLIALVNRLTLTLLAASHDLAFLGAVTSRLLVLVDGRLAADGPTQEILAARPLLERAGVI